MPSIYQSHHTGIETRQAEMCGSKYVTTNRTTLELKLVFAAKDYAAKNYQSHHTGIETTSVLPSPIKGYHYQSHHTGIETTIIETIIGNAWLTTNRTTLELKHSWMRRAATWTFVYQSHHTGIETRICKKNADYT